MAKKAQRKTNGDGLEQLHVKDLVPDPENAREHGERNIGLIVDAMHAVGAARSIVIDEGNRILAGNGAVEGAAEAGIYKVKVVEADGNEIVAVRRRGLTEDQKTQLALYDNRAAELARWSPAVLQALAARGLTGKMFTEDELAVVLAALERSEPEAPEGFNAPDESTEFCCPSCGFEWSGQPKPTADA